MSSKSVDLKSEKNIQNYLRTLSDEQINDYYENVEVSPFPVLVIREYQRRFGAKDKKLVEEKMRIRQQIYDLRKNQRKMADQIKKQLRDVEHNTLTLTRMAGMDEKSIKQNQKDREVAINALLEATKDLVYENNKIMRLEDEYIYLTDKKKS